VTDTGQDDLNKNTAADAHVAASSVLPTTPPVSPQPAQPDPVVDTANTKTITDDGLPLSPPAPAGDSGAEAALVPADNALQAFERYRQELYQLTEKAAQQVRADERQSGIFNKQVANARNSDYAVLLSEYVKLLASLSINKNIFYCEEAIIGLKLLSNGNLRSARRIVDHIRFLTSPSAPLEQITLGILTFILVVSVFLFVFILTSLMTSQLLGQEFVRHTMEVLVSVIFITADAGISHVFWAGVLGVVGGIVSLLLRLSEFEAMTGKSRIYLRSTGMTQPFVGGVFGIFMAALLSSKLVNINVGSEGTSTWLFVVLGFLSGFSERFSRSFINLAEERITGANAKAPDPTPAKPQASTAATGG
jgi:hypothetical protein